MMGAMLRPSGFWGAKFSRNGRQIWLGTFATKWEAEAAVAEAKTANRRMAPVNPPRRIHEDPVVYFVQVAPDGPIKIGVAHRSGVKGRLVTLQMANPSELALLATVDGGFDEERRIHERFAATRIRGEWFEPTDELLAFIASVAENAAKLSSYYAAADTEPEGNDGD